MKGSSSPFLPTLIMISSPSTISIQNFLNSVGLRMFGVPLSNWFAPARCPCFPSLMADCVLFHPPITISYPSHWGHGASRMWASVLPLTSNSREKWGVGSYWQSAALGYLTSGLSFHSPPIFLKWISTKSSFPSWSLGSPGNQLVNVHGLPSVHPQSPSEFLYPPVHEVSFVRVVKEVGSGVNYNRRLVVKLLYSRNII